LIFLFPAGSSLVLAAAFTPWPAPIIAGILVALTAAVVASERSVEPHASAGHQLSHHTRHYQEEAE
jgi:hypothetical protein